MTLDHDNHGLGYEDETADHVFTPEDMIVAINVECAVIEAMRKNHAWVPAIVESATNRIAVLSAARDYIRARRLSDSNPYDKLRETVVRLCFESRTYPADKQAPFLRDALLTLVDPLMVITQRIREHGSN